MLLEYDSLIYSIVRKNSEVSFAGGPRQVATEQGPQEAYHTGQSISCGSQGAGKKLFPFGRWNNRGTWEGVQVQGEMEN